MGPTPASHRSLWNPATNLFEVAVVRRKGPNLVIKDLPLETADRLRSYATIDICVEPWVSADTVTRTYQALQKQTLGHKNRPISARNAAAFRFVVERPRSRIKEYLSGVRNAGPDSWRRRLGDWNELHSKGDPWHYEDGEADKAARHFQRDVQRRALPKIARPRYTPSPRNRCGLA